MKLKRITMMILCGAVLTPALRIDAQSAAPAEKFGPKWHVLLGEWKGENGPKGGSGACTFRLELGGHIIVRTNYAVLPPGGNAPAGTHEDLMIIYPSSTEDKARAVYFDNEGHVIEYYSEWTNDGNTLLFVTKPGTGPTFKLVYEKVDPNTFSVRLETATPGQGGFKVHTAGKIKRGGG
jgi:hypothetical protein